MKVPCPSALYTQSPEACELTKLPLQAPTQGFQVVLADFRVLWIFVGIGQGYRDEPSLEGPERGSVDARQTPQEFSAACPGEAPYPVSGTSTVTLRRTELILCNGLLEGECGYRPTNRGGYVGNLLMWTLQRRLISLGFCLCGPICGVDKPSRVGRRRAEHVRSVSSYWRGHSTPHSKSLGSTLSAAASLRRVFGYAPLLRDSSCWTGVWATPASSPSCLWVRPRRRRCAARPGSGMLLNLSIIRTLLVLWVSPSLTRCKSGL